MRSRSSLRARGAACGILLAVTLACEGSPTDPDAALRPVLLSPAHAAEIVQNDPATGCAYTLPYGRGSRVDFDWNDVPGVTAYVIDFGHDGSFPQVHAVVTTSEYHHVNCGSFATFLDGWGWKVGSIRPRAGLPADTVWSMRRPLVYRPCLLDDGTPCRAS